MKKITRVFLLCLFVFSIQFSFAQGWQTIEEGQSYELDRVEISYITSYIKEVKGQDVYTITASISNNGPDIIYLFPRARYRFKKESRNAWGQFRFTNATGKGLSNRSGYIYPNEFRMKFPMKCDPEQEQDDYESRVIGVGLESGGSITKNWRVRVVKGKIPEVNVLLKSKY
jgi:hypothetical protein